VVFAALPHGVGEPFAKACVERGIPFIDLSADYRFDGDEAAFKAWYGKPFVHPEVRRHSVYGLPELNRPRIKELAAAGKVIVGNPGCYPTSASLGAFPAIARGLAAGLDGRAGCPAVIIVDSASGITGGGREPSRSFHFPECSDSLTAYKVGSHRHTPEISRNFAVMAARAAGASPAEGPAAAPGLIFTPHLAPINRGILSTIYIPLAPAWRAGGVSAAGPAAPPSGEIEKKAGEIRALYADFYREEPFVRVLPAGLTAATNRVRQSNYCDISVHLDQAGTTLIILSAIDNMVKGAAGQALQNMNIVMGFDERAGLEATPSLF
jgi:N-acetyl-gamma-glutamyl-phosphate reductase